MRLAIKLLALILFLFLVISMLAAYIPPSISLIFAIAGLGFPIFWILSATIVIISIMLRIKWISIIGLILLISSTVTFIRYFNIPLSNKYKKAQYSLFNFNTFGLKEPEVNSDQIANQLWLNSFIAEGDYTIACFQEYPMKGRKHAQFFQILDENTKLPYKTLSSYHWDQKNTDYILATVSKNIILDEAVLNDGNQNFAIYSDIRLPESVIRVFNIHLQSVKLTSERKLLMFNNNFNFSNIFKQIVDALNKLTIAYINREKQADILAEYIQNSPYPVILTGDFNDTPASYVYNKLNDGLKDASNNAGFGFKRTFKFSRLPLQIDYILHSKKIKTSGYRFLRSHISDHYAIDCQFTIEK